MSTHTVQSGDTLSKLAARYNTTVAALAQANGIRNVNLILVGQRLMIPGAGSNGGNVVIPAAGLRRGMTGQAVRQLQEALAQKGYMSREAIATGPGVFGPRTEAAVIAFQRANGLPQTGFYGNMTNAALARTFGAKPTPAPGNTTPPPSGGSSNVGGVPRYSQSDPRWGGRILGRNYTISAAGCAMTATAMAISAISGRPIDPGQLDAYLDAHGGYAGDGIYWDRAAQARGLNAAKAGFSLSAIDAQLKAGRPVVIGVDFKAGSGGGSNGTDHWVTVVARGVDSSGRAYYTINDPGGGGQYRLYASGGRLEGKGAGGYYRTTGELVVFSG